MSRRTEQVAEQIQQILGAVIQYELKDPRVGFATVTGVEVSADLHHARVRVSIMGDEAEKAETLTGLHKARGYMRRRVAEEMSHMRFVPDIHLVVDESLDYSMRIEALLREVEQERRENPPMLDGDA
jgi:ribosome-binding factor A